MKQQLLARVMRQSGLLFLLTKVVKWSGVLVLNYHRIGDGKASLFDRGLWSAATEVFDDQVQYCKNHFDVITPEDLPGVLRRGRGRHLLITFDDGYKDNYTEAFPILKSHGLKATFFICTGFIDDPTLPWWDEIAWMVRSSQKDVIRLSPWLPAPVVLDKPDREEAVRALLKVFKRMPSNTTSAFLDAIGEAAGTGRCGEKEGSNLSMTWEMIREMRAAGMIIGGHTISHPILCRMTPEQQWHEISHCGQRLASELGEPMRYFSYPDGMLWGFNSDTRECMARAGVEFAFSYYGGFQRFCDWDNYDIRRVGISEHVTSDRFRATLALPAIFARPRGLPSERLEPSDSCAPVPVQESPIGLR